MEAKQGYDGGMNQDTSVSKRQPNQYFSSSNFRILTNEGLSTGSLVNEKGHEITFVVPNVPEMTLTNGTIIPAQNDLKIIGGTFMVDTLIVFTTNETSTTPNGYGQIWKAIFNEDTGKVEGLTAANELNPSIHLVYNQKLNFSTEYRIGRAIALNETTTKQRVYWTDNYNPVRVFNLADTDTLNIPVENVDLFPGVTLSQPTVLSIGTGNLPTATQIQFSYRLLDINGGETTFAPATPMIPLPSPATDVDFGDFNGAGSSATPNKSVTYTIKGIDTDFDVIQHIAILYSNTNLTVWEFSEQPIPDTGEVEITCSSLDDAISVPLEIYSTIISGFTAAKDIEVQGNRLIAANIKTDTFDIDFDARAYRFNGLGLESDGIPRARPGDAVDPLATFVELVATAPNYSNVPEDHDAINVYNKEQEPNWFDPLQQYKYKTDGTTLGGDGLNISYEFTTKAFPANVNLTHPTVTPDHIDVTLNGSAATPDNFGVLEADGTTKEISKINQYDNFNSIWGPSNYTGYARGETYRFGIVFFNTKGSPSFVKWIGDIRFPDVTDGFPIQDMVGNVPYLYSLGIKFDIDISSIEDQISGYSIVRVERDDQNCTKLGTGFYMLFDEQEDTYTNSLIHTYDQSLGGGASSSNPYKVSNETNIYGVTGHKTLHLSDKPGFPTLPTTNHYGYLLSALGQLQDVSHKAGDYLDTLGYYDSTLANYQISSTSDTDKSFGFYYKLEDYITSPHTRERFEIRKIRNVNVGEFIFASDDFTDQMIPPYADHNIMNGTYVRAGGIAQVKEDYPLGIGSKKLFINLIRLTPPIVHGTASFNMQWSVPAGATTSGGWAGPDIAGSTTITWPNQVATQKPRFKLVGYRRYLETQYGGNSFADRSKNQYISTGHYQVTSGVPGASSLNFSVYGGDTYVNYYDEEQAEQYWHENQNHNEVYKEHNKNKLSVAVCLPCESRVNTDYRTGRHWASDRDGSSAGAMGNYASNQYQMQPIWTMPNTATEKFFAKDFLSDFTTEHPHQLWASEIKINGELIDSWRSFKIANTTEVDGIYGPINRIISFKDTLHYYQDRAFGAVSLDEKSVIQDQSGQELVLGTGGVFPDYKYISTNTGTIHQFSVVGTENAIYHYDARLAKFYQYTGGATPLSDLQGMSSFFANDIKGLILNTDKTTRFEGDMIGVHGTKDLRYHRVLYTFLNMQKSPSLEFYQQEDGSYYIPANSYFQNHEGVTYFTMGPITLAASIDPTKPFLSEDFKGVYKIPISLTIGYNELTQKFISFYDYTPSLYMEYGRRLLSVSPYERNKLYTHNVGPMGYYYDTILSKSKLHTIFPAPGQVNKIYNNLAFNTEVYDSNRKDIHNETLSRIRFYNNYQDTGVHELLVGNNIQRRMRTWRMYIPRDKDTPLSRMRNPWLHCELEYDNKEDKKIILHDLTYSFTPSNL